MLESEYQEQFLDKVRALLPKSKNRECKITKNDPGYIQGIPDWSIYYGKLYVILEIKRTKNAHRQPNQAYYVNLFSRMAYSSFVYPENEQQVLMELFEYFKGEIENDME